MLMVEIGDMRNEIMPEDVEDVARQITTMPSMVPTSVGANFACFNSTLPDAANMTTLTAVASDISAADRPVLETVSGGNSAKFSWIRGFHSKKRINNLRLSEALLPSVEPV